MSYIRTLVVHIRVFSNLPRHGIRQFRTSSNINRLLLTLDPTRMVNVGQRTMDIRNQKQFLINFPLLGANGQHQTSFGEPMRVNGSYIYAYIDYKAANPLKRSFHHFSFPPPAQGVLYYHRSTPEISSSVRFRICNDVRPPSFDAGQDLMLPPTYPGEKLPWEIPLVSLTSTKTHAPFLQTLLNDGLVDLPLVEHLRSFNAKQLSRDRHPLYTIDEPFVVDLSRSRTLSFLTMKGYLRTVVLQLPESFTGKVRVRFVVSPLPEHRDNPSLLLQCLEILTPIEQVHDKTSMKKPVAGEYIEKRGKIWSWPLKAAAKRRKMAEMFDIPL